MRLPSGGADPDRPRFHCEDKLLILADADGSNNCRYWLWKQQVQIQLADQFGIDVMICHYPTGASKYNPIEHRLFSQISCNWVGKSLRCWETLLNYIRGNIVSVCYNLTMTIQQIEQNLLLLPTREQLRLARLLLDSVLAVGEQSEDSADNALINWIGIFEGGSPDTARRLEEILVARLNPVHGFEGTFSTISAAAHSCL